MPPPPPSALFPYTTLFRSDLLRVLAQHGFDRREIVVARQQRVPRGARRHAWAGRHAEQPRRAVGRRAGHADRKSTRLNSSHLGISYAVFCLKKKTKINKLK